MFLLSLLGPAGQPAWKLVVAFSLTYTISSPLQIGGRFLVATCTWVQPELPVGLVLSQGRRHYLLLRDAFQACVYVIHLTVAVERQENISFQTS